MKFNLDRMSPAADPRDTTEPDTLAFAPFPLPQRLFVPISALPSGQPRPAGSVVAHGDILIEAGGGTSCCGSPVAGTVAASHTAVLCNGRSVRVVEVRPSTEQPPAVLDDAPPAVRVINLPDWITRFSRAGLDASRVGSPDLLQQLRRCVSIGIDTVVCSLLDGDPNLPVNATAARNAPTALAAGIDFLMKVTGAARSQTVAASTTPAEQLAELAPLLRSRSSRLVTLVNDYPQGDPTLLLHTLLGRRLKPHLLPVERGVLLLDAAAAVAVGELVLHGLMMARVPIALRDRVAGLTYLLSVPVGTRLSDVCSWIGTPVPTSVFRGGDLLRDCVLPASAVVGAGELAIHLSSREPVPNPDPCIRCGWCIDACPTRVHPARLLEASQRGDLTMANQFGLPACIECGICTYVCPSRLPLLSAIRVLRKGDPDAG